VTEKQTINSGTCNNKGLVWLQTGRRYWSMEWVGTHPLPTRVLPQEVAGNRGALAGSGC